MSIDPRDPVALTAALVRCPSVTPDEAGALSLIEAILRPVGFTVHRMTFTEPGTPDVENLYARLGAAGPNLCFAGHTDVVPAGNAAAWTQPPFAAAIEGGMLYGRGAVDMKGAIACFIAAVVRQLDRPTALNGASVSLLITGDEEGPSINGTAKILDWLAARAENLDACIVGEPSNPAALGDEIKIGRRGSLNGEITVAGKQGHAAYPQKADNPIPKLSRIIDRLSAEVIDNGNENFEPSRLQVTVISTPNTSTNVIPAEASAKFNIRYNDHWNRPRLEAWVRQKCGAAAQAAGARATVSFWGTGDVFLTRPGPLVHSLSNAVRTVTGRTPALTTGGGTSDARFIQAFCPVVEFGLVNETIHQVDERVAITDLEALTRIYEHFIADYVTNARRAV